MCGFVGVFGKNLDSSYKNKVIKASQTIKHRGPDDFGLYEDENFIVAHRRLKIIDLSDAAHQPMESQDKNFVIAYNGEVYNYIELKKEFNINYFSDSDTEVILNYLAFKGINALNEFNGMFAFAFFDKRQKELLLVRDRFGIKPLYYMRHKNNIIFASEIKAILSILDYTPQPDDLSLFQYIASGYGYIDVDEYTFFSGIKKIKPAHFMKISLNGSISERKWWDVSENKHKIKDIEQAAENIKEVLKSAIQLRLRSDVPYALALSGGIDSNVIALLLKKEKLLDNIKTFSISYHDFPGYDELKYITATIEKTGFHNFLIQPKADELKQTMYDITWYGDEPYSGASIFSQYKLFQEIKKHNITVVITGQGSDEIFAGYNKYDNFFYADLLKKFKIKPMALSPVLKIYFSRFLRRLSFSFINKIRINNALKQASNFFVNDSVIEKISRYSDKKRILKGYDKVEFSSFLDEELYNSLTISPLPSLLHTDDRNSMAHSIETRPVFLDYRLVNLAFAIDNSLKIFKDIKKYILRYMLKGYMPDVLYNRKDKMGFVTPMDEWFRQELQNDFLEKVSTSELIDYYGNKKKIIEYFKDNITTNTSIGFKIWIWYSLAIWEDVFYN